MGEPTWNPNVLDATKWLKTHIDPEYKIHPVVSTMMPRKNIWLKTFIHTWMRMKNRLLRGEAGLQLSINSTDEAERALSRLLAHANSTEAVRGLLEMDRVAGGIPDLARRVTAERAVDALGGRPEFGFNFDPSHLQWQGVDPAAFIRTFPDRIYHVHMKDCAVTLDGREGILASYLNFGERDRGWDFRSLGRGDVDFEALVRELNRIGYRGPLSVEWEDSGMDREHGAAEACDFVRSVDFPPSQIAFDAQFDK